MQTSPIGVVMMGRVVLQ